MSAAHLVVTGLVLIALALQLSVPTPASAHRGLVGVPTGATSRMILETSGIQCTFALDADTAAGACVGNNVNVRVVTSTVERGVGVLSLGLGVQNVGTLRLATIDGTTPDPAGVRLFVASGPFVTAGSGQAEILNADGVGAFTGSDQSYFAYAGALLGDDGILTPGETSGTRTWRLSTTGDVAQLDFSVGVWAEVPPSETPTSTATATPSPTLIATDTPIPSDTPTSAPTATPTPSPTPLSTATSVPTSTPTRTVPPTSTATNTPSTAPTRTPKPTKAPKG